MNLHDNVTEFVIIFIYHEYLVTSKCGQSEGTEDFLHLAHLRLLLGGARLDERLCLAHVPHQVVGQHVDAQLDIAEGGVLVVRDGDELLAQLLGDRAACLEHDLSLGRDGA